MIKIIAGKYKNRKLKHFNIGSIRPTQARVRKSMFDVIGDLSDKVVLDLFCGVGSIGIEALSRGAKSVYFVDSDLKALNILKDNLNLLKIDFNNYSIIKSDVFSYLFKQNQNFDLIVADPPYGKFCFPDLILNIKNKVKKNGIFCYESKKEKIDSDLNLKIKKYGNTQLIFWRNE